MSDYISDPSYDDYIAAYPPPSFPDIAQYLSAKKEFRLPLENFGHQELVSRLMTYLSRLLVMHHTGSGKSCTASKPAELFKRAIVDSTYWLLDAGRIQKVFVVVPNDALVDEFRYQISCVCTQNEYTKGISASDNEEARRKQVSRNIAEHYEVMRLSKFLNMFDPKSQKRTESRIRQHKVVGKRRLRNIEELRDAYLIIDEAQSLLTEDESSDLIEMQSGVTQIKHETMQTRSAKYNTIKSIISAVPTIKVAMFSGTANRNSGDDVGQLQRLLTSGTYGYTPLPEGISLEDMPLDQFARYFGGLVSILRDPGNTEDIDIEYQVNPYIPKPQSISMESSGSFRRIYITEMSGTQLAKYQEVSSAGGGQKSLSAISTFVFPDGTYKEAGVYKFFAPFDLTSPDYDLFKIRPEYIPAFDPAPHLPLERIAERLVILRSLSCKFYDVLLRIGRSIAENRPGVFFLATEFVQVGSRPLGAFLHHFLGMEPFRYDDMSVVFDTVQSGFCSSTREIRASVPKTRRYAIISGQTGTAKTATNKKSRRVQCILEVLRSKKNTNGEYIKAFIGTAAISIGVNLHAIDETDVLGGYWNNASVQQITGRSIRIGSHRDLLKQLTSLQEVNPHVQLLRNGKVPVNIRLHAAEARSPFGHGYISIDETMYETAGKKQVGIDEVERKLNAMDILCPLTAVRNGMSPDHCCKSKNPNPPYLPEDYSTYNNFYLKREFGTVIEYIEAQIKANGYVGVKEIIKYFYDNEISKRSTEEEAANYSNQLVIRALVYLIETKYKIETKPLQEASGVVFLGDTGKFDESFYSRLNMGTSIVPISQVPILNLNQKFKTIMTELNQIPVSNNINGPMLKLFAVDAWMNVFNKFSLQVKNALLESCIDTVVKSHGLSYVVAKRFNMNNPEERVLEYFRDKFFGINDEVLKETFDLMEKDRSSAKGDKSKGTRLYNVDLLKKLINKFLSYDDITTARKQNRNPGHIKAVVNRHTKIKQLVYPHYDDDKRVIDMGMYFRYLQLSVRNDSMEPGIHPSYTLDQHTASQIVQGKKGYLEIDPYIQRAPNFYDIKTDRINVSNIALYLVRLATDARELYSYLSLLPVDRNVIQQYYEYYVTTQPTPVAPRPVNSIVSIYNIYTNKDSAAKMVTSKFEQIDDRFPTRVYRNNSWSDSSNEINMCANIVWYDDYLTRLGNTRPDNLGSSNKEIRWAILSDGYVYVTRSNEISKLFVARDRDNNYNVLLQLRNSWDRDYFIDLI
jgi:hypothetical protein